MTVGLRRWPVTITGRKRFQASTRAELEVFEADGPRAKVNPLALWRSGEIRSYMDRYDLPRHPLVARGFPSIGCEPCTTRVLPGEDERAGRWRGARRRSSAAFISARMGRILRKAS